MILQVSGYLSYRLDSSLSSIIIHENSIFLGSYDICLRCFDLP